MVQTGLLKVNMAGDVYVMKTAIQTILINVDWRLFQMIGTATKRTYVPISTLVLGTESSCTRKLEVMNS